MSHSNLTYTVALLRHGVLRATITANARPMGYVGEYHNGTPYEPDTEHVAKLMPYMYRKAILRANTWWHGVVPACKMDLYNRKGKPMGTLVANPNWSKS